MLNLNPEPENPQIPNINPELQNRETSGGWRSLQESKGQHSPPGVRCTPGDRGRDGNAQKPLLENSC